MDSVANATTPSWGATTDDYCELDKNTKADEAYHCQWPNAPPFCDETWSDRVGASAVTASQIFYLFVFGILLVMHIRFFVWSQARLKIKKKTFFERTANEWMNLYVLMATAIRIIQELDFGNVLFMPLGITIFITESVVGIVVCTLFTIVWGWYKVLLPSADKAAKVKKADQIHTAFRCFAIGANMAAGVLGTVLIPDKYKGTGVTDGNIHAAARTILFVLCCILTIFANHLGHNIQRQLAEGAGKTKVAPDVAKGEGPIVKKKAEKTDAEKILGMVRKTVGVVSFMMLYFIYDIAGSVGRVRHITAPFCGGKDIWFRLTSVMQLLVFTAITIVFPVKKPDSKGKTGMMGTTRTGTGSVVTAVTATSSVD